MCLLTVFPMPGLLDSTILTGLETGAVANPDGSGWAVIQRGRIRTGKSMDADEAINTFLDAYLDATGPAIFHSRWATHGRKDLRNLHPFRVSGAGETYVAHNGVLPAEAWPADGDARSDTRIFAQEILSTRFRQLDSRETSSELSDWLADSKIAVLTTNRRYARQLYVYGLGAGEWVNGVWFSNGDYKRPAELEPTGQPASAEC